MSYLQTTFKNVMDWVDQRLPVTETYEKHMSKYYAPKNFNFWYFFGVLSVVVLVNQLLTGIWLTVNNLTPHHLRRMTIRESGKLHPIAGHLVQTDSICWISPMSQQ